MAVSVLPSPVCISTIDRLCMAIPPSTLHVEMPHVQGPPPRFADQGKCLDQNPFERLAATYSVTKPQALLAELRVSQRLERRFQLGNARQIGRPTSDPVAARQTQLATNS